MPYKRLRQGEIKNAYFWVIFGWRLEKKTWQISLLKMYFFTEQNLVLSLLCLQIKQHTDGQLYILHPDECRYLWACPRMKNDPFPVFSNTAGSNRSGCGHWHVHRLCVRCISACTLRNPLECGDGSGGRRGSLCRRCARSLRGNTVVHGGRNLCARILAGSGICAHPLWDHCPMGTFYARQDRGDALFCQKWCLWGHPGMILPCRWCQPAHWYPSVPEVHRLGYCRVRHPGQNNDGRIRPGMGRFYCRRKDACRRGKHGK